MTTYRRTRGRAWDIARDLRELIDKGVYAPGHQLPTGTKLANTYNVCRATAQTAVNHLIAQGLVSGEPGSGWFVNEAKVKFYASLIGSTLKRLETQGQSGAFRQQIEAQGMTASQEVTLSEVAATTDLSQRLHVPLGSQLILRTRVVFADGDPLMIANSYYPISIARGTPLALPAFIPQGGDQVLADSGHTPTTYQDEITGRMPTPDEVATLDISPGVPIGKLVRISFDQAEVAIEVCVMIFSWDRHILLYDIDA